MHPDQVPLVMLKDIMLPVAIRMFVKKDTSLVQRIDSHVLNFASSGILDYWKAKYLDRIPQHKFPKKFTFSQLRGIIHVCAGLYAISLIVFLLEGIVWKVQQGWPLKPR